MNNHKHIDNSLSSSGNDKPPGNDNLTFNDIIKDAKEHLDRFNNEESIKHNSGFTENIYKNLPKLLMDACSQFTDAIEREVFLVSALGVLSGCMPNYIGHYDGKWISPNLYVYLLAPYGTGKGAMTYARYLGNVIHTKNREQSNQAFKNYQQEMSDYKKASRKQKETMIEPTRPIQKLLFIPANSSKTSIIELLSDNNASGIIFENEGDTLADALKQEFASYSDILRKAFHHEPIAFARRADKEYKDLSQVYLSVVLSSTFDQLLKLIPSIQNGLYSRFLYYVLVPNRKFKNVFEKRKENYDQYFTDLGIEIEDHFNYLSSKGEKVIFTYTEDQKVRFLDFFSKEKLKSCEEMDGTVNRLGIICYRVAMVLSMLRQFEYNKPDKQIICKDIDFDNALAIIEVLRKNAEQVYEHISGSEIKQKISTEKYQQLFAQLPNEFTTSEGLELAKQIGIKSPRTFEDYLRRSIGKLFSHIDHGKYKKIV